MREFAILARASSSVLERKTGYVRALLVPFLTFSFLIVTALLFCDFVTIPAFVFLWLFAVFGHVAVLPAISAIPIELGGLIPPPSHQPQRLPALCSAQQQHRMLVAIGGK